MYLFVARSTGTDTWITEPLDPEDQYVIDDPDDPNFGTTVTERTYFDYKRPDCVLIGQCHTTKVFWHNAERWVVVTSDNAAPAGTYDVGDPSDPVFMASEPSKPEQNALEDELGLARGTLDGWTWQMIFDDALSHTDVWRAVFVDGSDVWLKGGP